MSGWRDRHGHHYASRCDGEAVIDENYGRTRSRQAVDVYIDRCSRTSAGPFLRTVLHVQAGDEIVEKPTRDLREVGQGNFTG